MSDTSNLTTWIDCVDSMNCMIIEQGHLTAFTRVLKSNDGGKNFELAWEGPFLGYPETVFYLDSTTAYFTTGTSRVFRSDDGGYQWEEVSKISNVDLLSFSPFHFRTPDSAIVVRNGYSVDTVYRTTDGWQSWTKEALLKPWEGQVYQKSVFANEFGNGRISVIWFWALGVTFGTKHPTTGDWRYTDIADSGSRFVDAVSVSESTYFCAIARYGSRPSTHSNVIYRSTDYGKTWENVFDETIADSLSIHDMEFRDSLHGLATTKGVILRTSDGGDTWSEEPMTPTPHFQNTIIASYPPGGDGVVLASRGWETRVWVPEEIGSVQDRTEEFGISGIQFSRGTDEEYTLTFNAEKSGPVTIQLYDVVGTEWFDLEYRVTVGANSVSVIPGTSSSQIGFLRLVSREGVVTVPVWIGG